MVERIQAREKHFLRLCPLGRRNCSRPVYRKIRRYRDSVRVPWSQPCAQRRACRGLSRARSAGRAVVSAVRAAQGVPWPQPGAQRRACRGLSRARSAGRAVVSAGRAAQGVPWSQPCAQRRACRGLGRAHSARRLPPACPALAPSDHTKPGGRLFIEAAPSRGAPRRGLGCRATPVPRARRSRRNRRPSPPPLWMKTPCIMATEIIRIRIRIRTFE
jgi:hypothetical protein